MQLNSTVKTYTSLLILTILALVVIKAFDISYPISVATTTKSSELAVVGEGKVEAVPDTANVDLGILVNNAPTVEAAQKTINETNNKIIDALKKLGIKKEDIKTSNYSIYPNQVFETEGVGRISGYNGNVTVSVKVRDIEKLPQVIQEATKAGANQVLGTNYLVENPEKAREEAREKAIKNAQDQAKNLAKRLGIRLGKVVNIVESSPGIPPIFGYREAQGFGGGGAVPPDLQPGSQTITSVVTLYFEKK